MFRVDTQFCGHPLSGEEQSAALGALADSRHVSMQLLPNHHIDAEQDLAGLGDLAGPQLGGHLQHPAGDLGDQSADGARLHETLKALLPTLTDVGKVWRSGANGAGPMMIELPDVSPSRQGSAKVEL